MMTSDPWGLLLNQRGGGSIDMSRGFSGFGNLPPLDWMPNPGAQHGIDDSGKFPWNVADSYTYFRWYESVLFERAREEDRRLLLGDSWKATRMLLADNSGEIQLDTSAPPTRAVFVGYIEKDGILYERYIINGQVEDIRANLTEDVTVVPREDSASTAGQGATDPAPYWVKETVIYKEEVDFYAGQGTAPAVPDHQFGYYPIAQKRDRVARHGTEEFRAGRYISGLIDYVQEVILSNAAQLENIMPYNAPDHFLAAGQYAKRWTWYSMRRQPYKGLYELGKGHLEAGDAVVGVEIGAAGVKGGYSVARSIDWGAVARAPAYAFVGMGVGGGVGTGKRAIPTLGPVLESSLPSGERAIPTLGPVLETSLQSEFSSAKGMIGPLSQEGIRLPETSGMGYATFEEFKAAHGEYPGFQWHHIVEQNSSNLARFGPYELHNTRNLRSLAYYEHTPISAFYSRAIAEGGPRYRDVVSTWTFAEQHDFGIRVMMKALEEL